MDLGKIVPPFEHFIVSELSPTTLFLAFKEKQGNIACPSGHKEEIMYSSTQPEEPARLPNIIEASRFYLPSSFCLGLLGPLFSFEIVICYH